MLDVNRTFTPSEAAVASGVPLKTAYAALATLLARHSQVHRSKLVGGMRSTNPMFRSTDDQFRSFLSNRGRFAVAIPPNAS